MAQPAQSIWRTLREFTSAWHPDIAWMRRDDRGDGTLARRFAMVGEDTVYLEGLTWFSDSDRTLAYSHIAGIGGVRDYNARISVTEDREGCLVSWGADIEADEPRASQIAAGTQSILARGLDWLAAHDGGSQGEVPPQQVREAEISKHIVGAAPRLSILATAGSGSTSPCIFLHGIGGNATNWQPQLQELGGGHRLAAVDMRGYGRSEPGSDPSRVEDYCDDILTLAGRLGADRVILCGLSMGAWIATSFAMRHADRLAGLVLAGGCTGMSEASAEARERFRNSRQRLLDAGQRPADFAPAIVDVIAGPHLTPELRETLRASTAAIPAQSYGDALNCFCNPAERFDFAPIRCPVLLMTGEYDRLAPPEEIRAVAQRMASIRRGTPEVRFEILAGAGHVCNLEAPERFNALLADFLQRCEIHPDREGV